MAVYINVVVTDVGITLLRNISLLSRALNAAGVVTSASVVSNPSQATTIPNVVQSQAYSLYSQGTNSFVLEAQLTNAGVTTAYNLNTIGFYANDGVGGNVLLAIISAQTPDLIPPESSYPINLNFKAFITLDSGGNVTINASFAGYATMEALGEHMESTVKSGDGVHGMRFFNEQLQLRDGAGWRDINNFPIESGSFTPNISFHSIPADTHVSSGVYNRTGDVVTFELYMEIELLSDYNFATTLPFITGIPYSINNIYRPSFNGKFGNAQDGSPMKDTFIFGDNTRICIGKRGSISADYYGITINGSYIIN